MRRLTVITPIEKRSEGFSTPVTYPVVVDMGPMGYTDITGQATSPGIPTPGLIVAVVVCEDEVADAIASDARFRILVDETDQPVQEGLLVKSGMSQSLETAVADPLMSLIDMGINETVAASLAGMDKCDQVTTLCEYFRGLV